MTDTESSSFPSKDRCEVSSTDRKQPSFGEARGSRPPKGRPEQTASPLPQRAHKAAMSSTRPAPGRLRALQNCTQTKNWCCFTRKNKPGWTV